MTPGTALSTAVALLLLLSPGAAGPRPAAAEETQAQQDDIAAGKASIASGDYQRAAALLERAAAGGKTAALEYLGLAYEKAGRLAQARAAYRRALAANAAVEDQTRIGERLRGVEAAMESDADAERTAARSAKLEASPQPPRPLPERPRVKAERPSDVWTWQRSGSMRQTYYRTDGFDGSAPLRGSLAGHLLGEDQFVTTGDLRVTGVKGSSEIAARLAVDGSLGGGDDQTVSLAYAEMRDRIDGLSARIGRQSRLDGGVFGRFDGVLLGAQATDRLLLQAVAGSPVYYGNATPFADDRVFAGLSMDLALDERWTASLYALEQRAGSAVDRRALGAGLRYGGEKLQAHAGVDYDVHYGEVNSATAAAEWQPGGRLSAYAELDFRRVPFLLTSNALLGQPVDNLSDLFDLFGSGGAEALAADRTASAATATLGGVYRMTEDWSLSLEASVADYSGTPASGGIDSIPDPGVEYYFTARLDGSGLFTGDDDAALALSYVESDYSRSLIADAMLRLPLGEDWRLSPRFRAVYRDRTEDDGADLLVMPSLGLTWRFAEHWDAETEAALLWERSKDSTGKHDQTELRLMIGIGYSF